jgi:hypothetical protein
LALLVTLAAGLGLALALSSGARAGEAVDCDVTPEDCSTVQIVIVGTGEGSVEEFADGGFHDTELDCNYFDLRQRGTCSELVPDGVHVGLRARPSSGTEFVGWSVRGGEHVHGCGQEVVCVVHPHGDDVRVLAQFEAVPNVPLTVIRQGSAAVQGTVASNPAGVLCGLDCTGSFPSGSTVVLTATVPAGVVFGGWGGDCAAFGTSLTCTLAMTEVRDVFATFNSATMPLSVSIVGGGTVGSLPLPGIACPSVCSAGFVTNSQVVLIALPRSGWRFSGWSGAGCSGAVACVVTMNQAQSVTATFTRTLVDAHVVLHRIGYTAANLRELRVRIDTDELVTVRLTLKRGGVTLQSTTVGNVGPAPFKLLEMSIRQRIPAGAASLEVLFTNSAGTEKRVVHSVRIPAKRQLT